MAKSFDASNGSAVMRLVAAAVLALGVALPLTGCTRSEPNECADGSACVLTAPVPTSTTATHTNGLLTGLLGTLQATSRDNKLCLALRQDDGAVISLVLPPGTKAAVTDKTRPDGQVRLTLIGANGLGGTRTGDRIAVTPDKRQQSAKVGGCARGPVVSVGWSSGCPL